MDRKDVKRIRAKLGMTQVEFAKAVGVSKRTVDCWERESNPRNVGPKNAEKLAKLEKEARRG
jgi:DNA-binding XRE family transcriptional regulator